MNTNKRKKILIAALLAVMMAVPMGLNAQTDGFFSEWDNAGGQREDKQEVTGGITNSGFDMPLSSGFAILVASAAGYTLLKRRKNRNSKTSKRQNHLSIIIALTMVSVLLTQCKKGEVQPTQVGGDTVNITLSVDNNSKVGFDPSTGGVDFVEGDRIYVASNRVYVGILTNNGTSFSGSITGATSGQPLHFYFLGNRTPSEELTAGTTEQLTVNISDQSESLPVISYGVSNETYGETTTFSATLDNQCAVVKFSKDLCEVCDEVLSIRKINNEVTVDLKEETFTASNEGNIRLNKIGEDYYAVIMPTEAISCKEAFSSPNCYIGTYSIPRVDANTYLTVGSTIEITKKSDYDFVDLGLPSGTLWATCNVGADSPEKYGAYFAWGETTVKSNYSWNSYKYYKDGNITKYNYYTDGIITLETSDDAATANLGGDWRMPTAEEFEELCYNTYFKWYDNYNETGKSGFVVYKAKSDKDKGLYTAGNGNTYTLDLEDATTIGDYNSTSDTHIFFPTAGYCDGASCINDGSCGYYWSSSLNLSTWSYAHGLEFGSDHVYLSEYFYRYCGLTVRPVR